MPEKPLVFSQRFEILAEGLTDGKLMDVLDLTLTPVRKLKTGSTQTIKLDAGLRLCQMRGASPYWLAGLPEPPADLVVEQDGVKFAIYAQTVAAADPDAAQAVLHGLADALRGVGAEVSEKNPVQAVPTPNRLGSVEARLASLERDAASTAEAVTKILALVQPPAVKRAPSGRKRRAS